MATRAEADVKTRTLDYDYSSFFYSSSDDVFTILEPYTEWYDEAQLRGYYLYAQPMLSAPAATDNARLATSSDLPTLGSRPPTECPAR